MSPSVTEEPSVEPTTPEPATAEPTEPTEPAPSEPTETSPSPIAPTKAPPDPPEPVPSDVAPTTYDEAVARFNAVGQEPQQLERFGSPDGNLYCVIDNDYLPAACEIDRGAIRDPAFCGPGPSQVVGRIEFAEGDPEAVCNSDTIREPGVPVLDLGSVAGFAGTDYQCLMEKVGLTCIDAGAPRGFFLARGTYQVFSG